MQTPTHSHLCYDVIVEKIIIGRYCWRLLLDVSQVHRLLKEPQPLLLVIVVVVFCQLVQFCPLFRIPVIAMRTTTTTTTAIIIIIITKIKAILI